MDRQIFTNEVMVVASVAMFVHLLGVIVILVRWRDADVIWTLALEVMQGVFVYYYLVVELNNATQISIFPIIGLIGRPTLVGTWIIIACYTIYRLRQKYLIRKIK